MKYSARDIAMGGLFGTLGVVLPIIFHLVGLGRAFLPMHLPVLVCGLLVSPTVAFAVGVVTPIASAALTGMPPIVPTGVLMVFELGALGLTASAARHRLRLPIVLSVVVAMAAARLLTSLEMLGLAPLMGLRQSPLAYLAASVVSSWPGMALQLIVAPLAVTSLGRISARTAADKEL
jgi:hypothetical protein